MTREEAIAKAVSILASIYSPERIYLFGSSVRGEARPDSDIDLLVVVPDDVPASRLWPSDVYHAMWEIPFAVEIVPVRRSTFERRANWVMSLPAIALREGRLLYDSGQRAA